MSSATADKIAETLSQYCDVLLKGGYNPDALGVDYLYVQDRFFRLEPTNALTTEKHGSGCVLSASIVAKMALDQNVYLPLVEMLKFISKTTYHQTLQN
jgi:hydroxymethylpyrimidine/phosphomethylpyrimidine kinase